MMTNDTFQEKRQSKRYLCDEFFTRCTLESEAENLDITLIDFSKEGLGLFSYEVIPESGNVFLSMCYQSPTLSHEFHQLSCSIVHCNLTEVGSHFGICFHLNKLSQADITALEEIESCLVNLDDPEDRYHLNGND